MEEEMKLIIAGSRHLNEDDIHDALVDFFWNNKELYNQVTEVVSGCARGADQTGELYAFNCDWPVKKFPADWDTHGRAAGHIRNKAMAEYADCLLLVWDGQSKGSRNMKENMKRLGKPVYEVVIKLKN